MTPPLIAFNHEIRRSPCFGHALKDCLYFALLCISCSINAQTVTINDTEFAAADWAATVTSSSGGATQSVSQPATGGNPGAYRHMTHVLPGNSNIVVVHQYLGASYNPSLQGAIDSVDYTEDHIQFNPPFAGAAIGASPALKQAGVWYFGPDLTFTTLNWQTANLTGLTQLDFTGPGGSHPDFTASGGEITFGFHRSNTNSSGGAKGTNDIKGLGYSTNNGIDNWAYTIHGQSLPVVSVQATDANAGEAGPDTGAMTVSRTGATTTALTVSYSVSGSATPGTDYAALSGTLMIPAGATSAGITITPIDDNQAEPDETIILALSPGAGYTLGSPTQATVVISDNDTAVAVIPVPALSLWGMLVLLLAMVTFGIVANANRIHR